MLEAEVKHGTLTAQAINDGQSKVFAHKKTLNPEPPNP